MKSKDETLIIENNGIKLRRCCKCKIYKDFSHFYRSNNKTSREGLHPECKECHNTRKKLKYKPTPKELKYGRVISQRDYKLRSTYGISEEDYNKKLKEQNGVCSICKGYNESGHFLSVDHNHKTGQVRGLLCFKCNPALSKVESIPNWSTLVTAYLDKYKKH